MANTITLTQFDPSELKKLLEESITGLKEEIEKYILTHSKRNEALLTREEAASLLKVSFPTLNKWSKEGTIKAYRVGSRVLYKQDELLEALQLFKTYKNL